MDQSNRPPEVRRISRRDVLKLGGAFAAGSTVGAAGLWWLRHREGGLRAPVFIARVDSYQHDLTSTILDGLRALNVTSSQIRGKRVLLKPNLVETAPGKAHINTHPAMVVAAAEAFRRLEAGAVCVAEGQGHRRDSWLVLEESGMRQAIDDAKLPFFDLNHDDIVTVPNTARWTKLSRLHLPRQIQTVDLVVSMPKLKTHHWTGVTCSMKNLFGVMPGVVYGWPKNVFHRAGIQRSILDICATVRPGLAIVDGVIGMEGDGPIMGQPKHLGAVVLGQNLTAVDATCVRLMKLNPFGMPYLRVSSGRYGPIRARNIEQRGESIASLCTRFDIIDAEHLRPVGDVA